MKCACPKCHADVALDIAKVSEDGTSVSCSGCKTRFFAYQESFACRALRKPGEITCRHCGAALGHTQYCPDCRVVYPDYVYATIAKKQVRKVKEAFSLKESFFPGHVVRKGSSPQLEITKTQVAKPQAAGLLQKYRMQAIAALVLVAVAAMGAYFYMVHKSQQKYAAEYVRALYGMKMGRDLSLKACAKLSTTWKTSMDAGQSGIPRISADDETRLAKIKGEVDTVMKTVDQPPKAFVGAHEKLSALYAGYQKIHSSAVAPSGSWAAYNDSLAKQDSDFRRKAADLKAALPEMLADEFKEGQQKYRGLRDF